MGESDHAIVPLKKLLSIPGQGALAQYMSLTPALLRLDPMLDPFSGAIRAFKNSATKSSRKTQQSSSEHSGCNQLQSADAITRL